MEAVALSDIASIQASLGRREEALSAYEAAHLIYTRADRFDGSAVQSRNDAAGVLWSIARLHADAGDVSLAADGYLEALAQYTGVYESNPSHPSVSSNRSGVSYDLAEILAAHPELEQHQRFHEEFLGGPVARSSLDRFAIWSLISDGDRHAALGEIDLALEMFSRALRKAEQRLAAHPDNMTYRRELWVANLRAAELDTPRAQEFAGAASAIMWELHQAGALDESDLEYLEQAERLSSQVGE